jgi:hypothetical protein
MHPPRFRTRSAPTGLFCLPPLRRQVSAQQCKSPPLVHQRLPRARELLGRVGEGGLTAGGGGVKGVVRRCCGGQLRLQLPYLRTSKAVGHFKLGSGAR